MKITIVGSGLAGCTAAYLLNQKGHEVTIFEQRDHIGGNCYDSMIDDIRVHMYGSHIFHTNSYEAYNFITQFTKIKKLSPTVYANTKKGFISVPLTRNLCDSLKIKSKKDVINLIFRDYSEKQWGMSYEHLPKEIKSRVPLIREDNDRHYFKDIYQGIPENGYFDMFLNMIRGSKIHLNCKKDDWKNDDSDIVLFSGSIDQFYDYKFGRLKYRSLEFTHLKADKRMYHVVNECNKLPFTRTIDNSFWMKTTGNNTIITKEFPCEHTKDRIPYYPFPDKKNINLYKKYKKIKNDKIIFIGRLGLYKYFNMDEIILDTMDKVREI